MNKPEYHKKWYERNRERRREQIVNRRKELIQWLKEYKATLKCSRCPENHPSCLQFHHRDPSKKEISVSHAILKGWSKARILKEIEKCEVLCANCHFKLHWNDGLSSNG